MQFFMFWLSAFINPLSAVYIFSGLVGIVFALATFRRK